MRLGVRQETKTNRRLTMNSDFKNREAFKNVLFQCHSFVEETFLALQGFSNVQRLGLFTKILIGL